MVVVVQEGVGSLQVFVLLLLLFVWLQHALLMLLRLLLAPPILNADLFIYLVLGVDVLVQHALR